MLEGAGAWVSLALGGSAILGQILSVVFFMFKLSNLPKELKDFKSDIGVDIAAIKSDVKETLESVGGMRVHIAEMQVQVDADHSSLGRLRDSDIADLRRQFNEMRDARRGGGSS